MLERLAKTNGSKLRVVKVNVDKDKSWAAKEKIKGIPAFQVYSGGMLMETFTGALPEKHFQSKVDQYASVASSGKPGEKAAKPTIQPMSKDWLPPGVSAE